jgi:transcriptional regulator with XRE-family HTH domain
MNRLPEKLNLLRKSSGLTQSEIASRLMVPVAEYMNWENGNSIPGIDQLKQISILFHVDLSALIDNTMTFVAPSSMGTAGTAEGSATIPFARQNDVNATETLGSTRNIAADDTGATKQLGTASDLSEVEEDHDLGEKAHTSRQGSSGKKQTAKKPVKKKKKKSKWIIAVCAAAAVVVVLLLVLVNGNLGSTASMDNERRLILTDQYSLYISDDGDLTGHGQNYSSVASKLKNCVQISAYSSDFAAGLKKNGTVVTTSDSLDTSSWENITSIAAGSDHVVGLKDDGTVVCTGNDSACQVDDWTDVASVYAGDGVTIGLTSEGSFVSSGGVGIPDVTGVKAVAVTDSAVYYETSSGSVKMISLTADASGLSTSSLTGVKTLVASDQILAGLNSDGTVEISTSDSDISTAVKSWENVAAIAVYDDTIVGYTKSGEMYGAGSNDYGQYVNTAGTEAETATPTATATAAAAEQLDMVSNVTFSTTTKSLQISWDAVSNADYYIVTISPDIGELAKATGTSVSVPASSLTSGTTYTVSIVAYASDTDQYTASDAVNVTYTYEDKTIQLDTPTNITGTVDSGGAWTIMWDAVDNADSYSITLDGSSIVTINQTYYTFSKDNYGLQSGGSYTIGITAHSNDESYTDSTEGQAVLTYTYETATPTTETDDHTEEAAENG